MTVKPVVADVTEYTDPICSWAWGTEPKLRLLRWRFDDRMSWRVVMGGLVGDATSGRSDWDPVLAAKPMQTYWKRTSVFTGQPFPMPMHRMAWSTDPAGRAVRAAFLQGSKVGNCVLRRLRESTFIFGLTPDSLGQFAEAGKGLPGLDIKRWLGDIESDETQRAYRADWEETRNPNDHVRFLEGDEVGIGSMKHSEGHDRYAFPTLIFRGPEGEATVAGWMPFDAYLQALETVLPGSTADPRPGPSPAEAFREWGTLTAQELKDLCGPTAGSSENPLPADVVAHNWGNGVVFLTREEAFARNLAPTTPAAAQAYLDFTTVLDRACELVASVQAHQWVLPTPCVDWNVRDLVNHMVGGTNMVTYGFLGKEIGPSFYGDHLGADPAAAYRTAIDQVTAILRADVGLWHRVLPMPWGETSGERLVEMFMGDHLIHAWDLGQSVGVTLRFDDALVRRAQIFADDYVSTRRGPGMFEAAVTVSSEESPLDRLAAFVGHRPLSPERP